MHFSAEMLSWDACYTRKILDKTGGNTIPLMLRVRPVKTFATPGRKNASKSFKFQLENIYFHDRKEFPSHT